MKELTIDDIRGQEGLGVGSFTTSNECSSFSAVIHFKHDPEDNSVLLSMQDSPEETDASQWFDKTALQELIEFLEYLRNRL